MTQPTSPDQARTAAVRFGLAFTVAAAGVAMSNLDLFVVNVALPNISTAFHGTSLSSLSWILNAYSVVFAALLVPAGSLADRFGPRRAYLAGVAVFTAASVLCAVAPGVWFLVGARVLQAAGAAVLIPASLGLVLALAPPEQRASAVRRWAALSGVAAALGPVVGGALAAADWRWIFLINLPVGLATIVAGRFVVADISGRGATGPVDFLGAALLTAGIATVALGLVKGEDWGWSSARLVIALVVAACLLALFAWHSARHPSPVVPPSLLRLPAMRPAMTANLLFAVAFGAMLLSVALWCEQVWHWSALLAGLGIFPGPLMVPSLTKYAGVAVRRFGAGIVAVGGCVVFAVGLGWWIASLSVASHDYLTGLLPGMLLTGIGVCFTMPTLIGAAVSKVPPASFSTGSAVVTVARQAGGVIGVAGLVAVLGHSYGPGAAARVFDHGWEFTAAATLAAAVACLFLSQRAKPLTAAEPARSAAASGRGSSDGG